jgi:hypothetical protein
MKGAIRPIALLTQLLGACASTGAPATQNAASPGPGINATTRPKVDGQAGREESAEGEAVARQFLGERRGGAWKAGAAYQWVTVGNLYWVMGPLEPPLLVAVPGAGRPPVLLTGDIAALKSFLALQFNGRLPDVGALNGIAQLVKDAVIGKGGSIGSREFFQSQRDGLDEWLKGRERDPAEFERLCSGIRGSLAKNEWTLEFNVINARGGVDVVRAAGTASPLTLQHVSVGVVKARGAFSYPLEVRPQGDAPGLTGGASPR